jgi:glycosyltransferase involved in cell wall biosynthesis
MIIILHDRNKVVKILNDGIEFKINLLNKPVSKVIMSLASENEEEILIWCHISLKETINLSIIPSLFDGKDLIFSYNTNDENILSEAIGYVEQTPFIKINKKVRYPTWIMSTHIGAVQSKTLNILKSVIKTSRNFDYFLNSIAKTGQPLGLFCYSEPNLLFCAYGKSIKRTFNSFLLFKFVRQHYKFIWIWLLFINLLIYEKRFKILPLLIACFYKKQKLPDCILDNASKESNQKIISSIDVIIPTIGRKPYLYDFLTDLNSQTLLPVNVIIVEQNPDPGSQSELDFIHGENWKFNICHIFSHLPGVCNARNIAIEKLESEWAFLADDDVRITRDFLKQCMDEISVIGNDAFTIANKQPNEELIKNTTRQFETFGTCSSIVKRNIIENLRFDLRYEFGFGEDADFGMQLRNKGIDIVYLPEPVIQHLKAPAGGFRTKHHFLWDNELILPKPSPTVMLYNILHQTPTQILGYKTISFFKFYKSLNAKLPMEYFKIFRARWQKSVEWAIFLQQKK